MSKTGTEVEALGQSCLQDTSTARPYWLLLQIENVLDASDQTASLPMNRWSRLRSRRGAMFAMSPGRVTSPMSVSG